MRAPSYGPACCARFTPAQARPAARIIGADFIESRIACSQPVVLSTSAEHLERALEPLARDPAGGSYYDRSST